MHDKNYLFEGLRVMRLLTDSREIAWQGCCYTPAAGMVLEIGPETDLVTIEEKYDCYQSPDRIAINGLHFYGHATEGKSYSQLRCSTF